MCQLYDWYLILTYIKKDVSCVIQSSTILFLEIWLITQVDCYSYFKKNFVKYSTLLFKIP